MYKVGFHSCSSASETRWKQRVKRRHRRHPVFARRPETPAICAQANSALFRAETGTEHPEQVMCLPVARGSQPTIVVSRHCGLLVFGRNYGWRSGAASEVFTSRPPVASGLSSGRLAHFEPSLWSSRAITRQELEGRAAGDAVTVLRAR